VLVPQDDVLGHLVHRAQSLRARVPNVWFVARDQEQNGQVRSTHACVNYSLPPELLIV
jgi:hypothetical protein